MAIHVTSSAFPDGGTIPEKYSCDGQDVSPQLEWRGAPDKTRSVVLMCDDPDAPNGPFAHWILYDIPATTTKLEEGAAEGGTSGINSFGKPGYGGPCPPHGGPPHHYAFHVYAVDVPSIGKPRMTRQAVIDAMKGHVLGDGELIGEYQRKRK
jgi:Raf kinase inhibitor-like YbhB/YbcL family protein